MVGIGADLHAGVIMQIIASHAGQAEADGNRAGRAGSLAFLTGRNVGSDVESSNVVNRAGLGTGVARNHQVVGLFTDVANRR